MKRHRWFLNPILLSLLVLAWSGTSAFAQIASPISQLQIPTVGTYTESDGTVMAVSGSMTVNSIQVTDANGLNPRVILTFDYSNVVAQSGHGNNTKVYGTGGFQTTKIRPLRATDVLPITCPYFTAQLGILSADEWLVTATLNFNVNSGKLTSGSATVGANPY